jgi:UDP-3-O-[3-hydroxymyristoyl] glucosamine N-acyltransferase
MEKSVAEIAALIEGRVVGDGSRTIRGAASLEDAGETDITFLRDAHKAGALDRLARTRAGVVLVVPGVATNGKTCIETANPVAGFAAILAIIAEEQAIRRPGVHPSAIVAPSARIDATASIGPLCVIEEDANLGAHTTLVAQVFVGARAEVGSHSLLHPQVVLRENVRIGARCIVHAGAVIGSDGFGFYFDQGQHRKIPQVGTVIVEDDVEIGSCAAIDRATTGVTIIGRGTKIDNLVQIGHNVTVGPLCLLSAQTGIAGSSRLGQGVIAGGQVGIADHVTIGDGASIGAQSGIQADVPPGVRMFGTPAQLLVETVRQAALVRRLRELFKDVKALKQKLEERS